MVSEKLKASLGASVSALISERRRVEDEIVEMEQRMAGTDISDAQVRALRDRVAKLEQQAAEERALLAKVEEQKQALARDKAAADAAARQAEIDAAKQALRAEVGAYLSDYAALVRNLRGAAHGIATLMARMREIGVWCQHLSAHGQAPLLCDRLAQEKRLAYLVAHCMRRIPGHRERLGDLAWPSFADAEHPVGLDPVAAEGDRMQRHIVDAYAAVEG
jgi:hypothetical protein